MARFFAGFFAAGLRARGGFGARRGTAAGIPGMPASSDGGSPASAAAKREIVKRLKAQLEPLAAGVDDARTAVGRRRHELVRFEIDAKVLKSEAQRRVNALRKAIRSLSLECRVDPPRIRHLAAAALQRSLVVALSLRPVSYTHLTLPTKA